MKRTLLLFLLVAMFFNVKGQTTPWINAGAVWNYKFEWGAGAGNDVIAYTHDTVINGKTCQVLHTTRYMYAIPGPGLPWAYAGSTTFPDNFTYANGDTVFYLTDSTFKVLYNFGANTGTMWYLGSPNPSAGCGRATVLTDSASTINIGGNSHRIIYTSDSSSASPMGFAGPSIEHIGNMEYLFPTGRNCDSTISVDWYFFSFSCFSDAFESYSVVAPEECDNPFHVGVTENTLSQVITSPNPSQEKITVTFPNTDICSIRLYNALGELLFSTSTAQQNFEINLSYLDKGIYFVSITDSKNENIIRKIVKR